MTKPLTLARFRDLADAYGGVVARWPEPERDAAMGMATSREGAEILAAAVSLDETLDLWRVPAPSGAFTARMMAGAPRPPRGFASRARLWWSGIGIAAALTGAIAGSAAVAIAAPIEAAPDTGTSFGDVTGQEG